MLRECFEFLLTPCPTTYGKLGYLRESIAIEARARRLKKAWKPHLENTHAIINEATRAIQPARSVWVVGSGALLDIPLNSLIERFESVVLIDIVHPLSTRLKVRKHPNVTLVACDLLGMGDALAELKHGASHLPKPNPPKLDHPKPDCIISANTLAQLPLIPVEHAHHLDIPESQIAPWNERILKSHLSFLRSQQCPICLITETKRHFKNTRENSIDTLDALPGITLPTPDRTWTWEVAPQGEINRNTHATFEISAFKSLPNQ